MKVPGGEYKKFPFFLFGNEEDFACGEKDSESSVSREMMSPVDKPPAFGSARRQNVTIVHTNDVHAQLEGMKGEKEGEMIGGIDLMGTVIRQEVKKDDEHTLLLDAGDISTGSPVSNYFKGKPMIDSMNMLSYDAMTLGNHDIEEGADAVRLITTRADFPVLSANLIDKTEGKSLGDIKPYVIKQVGDLKVGILGLTTVDTMSMLSPDEREMVQLTAARETAKKVVPQMKKEGAQMVVLLSHLGLDKDKDIARFVKGIDVIVGGHSHSELRKPIIVGKTIIVQTGSHSRNVGRLDLQVETKDGKSRVIKARSKLIPVNRNKDTADLFTHFMINRYSSQLAPIMNREIGEAAADLTQEDYHTNVAESPLTNFVTDAMKEYGQADGAIINASALRTDIPSGRIKVGNIYQLLPWKTKTSLLEMKGKDVKDAVEQIMTSFLNNPAISGFKVDVDTSKPEGSRVVKMTEADGKPLDPEKTYKIATIEWLANGSANVDAFTRALSRKDDEKDLKDVLIEKIERESQITAQNDGRLVDMA